MEQPQTSNKQKISFTSKEKIAYGILGVGLFLSGLYLLIFGSLAGAYNGYASFGPIGNRVGGLIIGVIGYYVIKKIIKK